MNQAKAAAQAKYPVSKVIHSAITIFLMFLFGRVIPPFGGITDKSNVPLHSVQRDICFLLR